MIKSEFFLEWRSSISGKIFFFLWTWLLPIVILWAVFHGFSEKKAQLLNFELSSTNQIWFWLCIAFLPVNLLLEALKWTWLVERIEATPILKSLKVILAGKSLNALLPLGLGSGASKYLATHQVDKQKTVAALTIGNFTQFVPAFLIGLIPLYQVFGHSISQYLWLGLIVVLFMGLALFFMLKTKFEHNWNKLYAAFSAYSRFEYISVLVVSILRYSVFTFQFIAIFHFLGIDLNQSVIFMGVAWIFFVKTVVPNASLLGDLMKRELSAYLFFQFYMEDLQPVFLANVLVWMVNIVVPAVVGSLFVSSLKKHI